MTTDRRSWNTPVRENWNVLIHECLRGISRHVSLYLETKDKNHLMMAESLRCYVRELKNWILTQEQHQE